MSDRAVSARPVGAERVRYSLRIRGLTLLSGDRHRDRLAESLHRPVQVITDLKGQSMRTWGKLHVDTGPTGAEVHPRCRHRDHGTHGKTVRIDAHMMVTQIRPRVRHNRTLRDRFDLEILYGKFQMNGARDRCTVLWLRKEHSGPGRLRFAARHSERDRCQGECSHDRCCSHSVQSVSPRMNSRMNARVEISHRR